MYQIGECVVYGIHGVCRVVGTEKQLVGRKRVEYLVLEPLGQTESRYFIPAASEVAMAKLRPVLQQETLRELMESDSIREDCWISDENARKQYYRELIGSGDRVAQLRMVTTLYRYRSAQYAAGKKFHQCDENFLRDAEKLLTSEICLVFEMDQDAALKYLRDHLQNA